MLWKGEIEDGAARELTMGEVRYAIAGDPVDHSLSPLLLGLVHARILDLVGPKDLNLQLKGRHLVATSHIEDAFAWGYAGSVPDAPNWAYTNAPFGKFRTSGLLAKAIEAGMAVEDADDRFAPMGEAAVSWASHSVRVDSKIRLPTGFLNKEIWMNLTSPLKHQLASNAVSAIDDSMVHQSVNALRWDGQGWLVCGFGRCRSCCFSPAFWRFIRIKTNPFSMRWRRCCPLSCVDMACSGGAEFTLQPPVGPLPEELQSQCTASSKNAVFGVNFDAELASAQAPFILNADYRPFEGDVESMLSSMCVPSLNGRWMLVAQHLSCWATLWAPHLRDILPSIDLLLTQLIHAEGLLSAYA